MARLTNALRAWMAELKDAQFQMQQAAFITVLEANQTNYINILVEEAESALGQVKEFDLPQFRRPLLMALKNNEAIKYRLQDDGSVRVIMDIGEVAGYPEDYFSAVESTRAKFPMTMDSTGASWFWRVFIYGQAREGVILRDKPKKNKDGSKSKRPGKSQAARGKAMYRATIEDRISNWDSPAPFWYILNYGNPTGGEGTPYPSHGGTQFVDKAEIKIWTDFNNKLRAEADRLFTSLQQQDFGGTSVLQDIQTAIATFDFNSARDFTPGQILTELEIKSRLYKIYVTRTGMLGMALR